MLDYAANAVVYWPVERLRARLESRLPHPAREIEELTSGSMDVESFWEQVKTNLHAGKVRLIFVADIVPLELQRIVEFLNSQLRSAEVLALEGQTVRRGRVPGAGLADDRRDGSCSRDKVSRLPDAA
jgi:hypothetical protein